MRLPSLLALLAALAGCGTEENFVVSGLPGVTISPVRSSISTRATFTDANGGQHPQWVIAMTDAPDLCAKVTAHPDYFRNPIENFDAMPRVVRFPGVAVLGANIGLSQFDAGPGGEAKGNFDVLVADPNGIAREMIGKFKATYCAGAEQAQLP